MSVNNIALASRLNAMMEKYPKNVVLGTPVNEIRPVSLRRPSFDCNWYWGFGYLGNLECHYHLSGLADGKNINLFDAIKQHFGDSLIFKDDALLWQFCEVVNTVYALCKMSELLYIGGSNYSNNPCRDELKAKKEWYVEINEVLIPNQIAAMYDILAKVDAD